MKRFLVFMTLLPGPLTFLAYDLLVEMYPDYALGLLQARKEVATLVAGFSFTMLGFLAAIITILFAFVNSEAFKRYKRGGYLDLLFFLYVFTVLDLVVTAFLSLYGFSNQVFEWPFKIMVMFFENSLIQVMIITIIISNLARNATNEHV